MCKKPLVCWLIGFSLMVMLAACGVPFVTDNGTRTNGPIIITTDHATYTTTSPIKFSVINHTKSPIYVSNAQSGCTILELEIQMNGQWQPSDEVACQTGKLPARITIAPGQTYTGTIRVGASKGKSSALPTGTYRLALFYRSATTSFSHL